MLNGATAVDPRAHSGVAPQGSAQGVSYSAVAALARDWLARSSMAPPAQRAGAVAVLAAVTLVIAVLTDRSTVAMLPVLAAASGQSGGRSAALSSGGRAPATRAGISRPEKES